MVVVVGEGEGGVEVIRMGIARTPVREDGASSFYVFFSWMYRVDVFIAELEGVAVSKYRVMGHHVLTRFKKKTEPNQRTSPLYIIPNITLQLCTLPETYLIKACKTACMTL